MENKKSLELVIAWIEGHPLFKWSGMCAKVGIDKANFQKVMKSDKPRISPDILQKIIVEMNDYGYVDGGGLPLPADYVEVKDVAILHTNGVVEKIVPPKVKSKKNKVNKKGKSKAKVTVTDLTKPTGKKVVSDPPPKTNFTIAMPVRKKGEDAFDFASRKNEWKRKNSK